MRTLKELSFNGYPTKRELQNKLLRVARESNKRQTRSGHVYQLASQP